MDQSVLPVGVDTRMVLGSLPRIGEIPLLLLLHEPKVLYHGVLDRAAPQHAHEHVVGVLEAQTSACQRGHAAQAAKLRSQRSANGSVLLRGK
jgi:hypothetical protein